MFFYHFLYSFVPFQHPFSINSLQDTILSCSPQKGSQLVSRYKLTLYGISIMTTLQCNVLLHEVHEENNRAVAYTVSYLFNSQTYSLPWEQNPNILWNDNMAIEIFVFPESFAAWGDHVTYFRKRPKQKSPGSFQECFYFLEFREQI